MHTRAFLDAIMFQANTYFGVDGCEFQARVTDAPGRPIGPTGDYFLAVYNLPQTREGVIGYYPRYGAGLTLSGRLRGRMVTDLTGFLQTPRTGFNDVLDALGAFLHRNRYQILHWANLLADADPPSQGILTNMVEAPMPSSCGPPQKKAADWWGEMVGQVKARSGNTEDAQAVGYAADLVYGGALTMQDVPADY